MSEEGDEITKSATARPTKHPQFATSSTIIAGHNRRERESIHVIGAKIAEQPASLDGVTLLLRFNRLNSSSCGFNEPPRDGVQNHLVQLDFLESNGSGGKCDGSGMAQLANLHRSRAVSILDW